MTKKRIQFNNIIQNQLPSYVREEFPLVAEFLKQYYTSQEFQGAPADLIQNIDQYIKLDNIKSESELTTLSSDITFLDETIQVSSTVGFPDSYGLLLIDSEIITYTSKTLNSFTGCVRGFSGITSNALANSRDELVFSSTESDNHKSGSKVTNLSSIFLLEFFNKIKYQISPGFENKEFYSSLDKYLFLKQSKDFYSTRGTEESFKILFKVLYGEEVEIIRPQEQLIKPSNANYTITNDLVVEILEGDPYDLQNSTLYQDAYLEIPSGYAPISSVKKINSIDGKNYYQLSFDAGYNRDLIVDGSLYGNFSVHPSTKLIGDVLVGDKTLNVDSTLGFPDNGELLVTYANGLQGVVTYASKNINQFFGCSNIISTISDESDINLNVYARNSNNTIKVRVTSVLTDLDIKDETYYQVRGDKCIIKDLGSSEIDVVSNNWIFNSQLNFVVSNIQNINSANKIYRIETSENAYLRIGDLIYIISNTGEKYSSQVLSVESEKIFTTQIERVLDEQLSYTITRQLLKVNHSNYVGLSSEIANIQNVYKKDGRTLVASSSIPNYIIPLTTDNRQIRFNVTVLASENNPIDTFFIGNHGFYTGDLIYYTPGSTPLFNEGLYYIKRVSKTEIKFAKSKSDIYDSTYIQVSTAIEGSTDNLIIDFDLYQKTLKSQKLLRQIDAPTFEKENYETKPGSLGIFINGVELFNYKSKDKVYYGNLEKIDVIDSGTQYDVINPPILNISDSSGSGADGYCSTKGSLQEIRIIDPGFDYLETPKIEITGGNGTGAKASAVMKSIDYQVSFNAESSNILNLSNNTIGFSTYHKLRNAEKLIYRTDGQTSVGGLSTNSTYYASVQNSQSIRLHRSFDDAVLGINTISLTSYGTGNHSLESLNKKSVISLINIEDSGSDYENKKRIYQSTDIEKSFEEITIKDHGFKSGEIVRYEVEGTSIVGLSSNTNYYVTKVDEDNFRLSNINSNSDSSDFYYRTNQYIKFKNIGSGTHIFNYPPISVSVVGPIGISSIGNNTFKADIQPIFRGEITSVHLTDGGVGYGSSEILNFDREPNITLNSGSGSVLSPIINNGQIVEVLVINGGSGYNSPPNLDIFSDTGIGAVLTPIIENGVIVSVNIIEAGIGYEKNNTTITALASGTGCKLRTFIKTWNVDLVKKYFDTIGDDDGFIINNPSTKYELQYGHLYSPRKLRENAYSVELGGKILYGKFDLRKSNSIEVSSNNHSPIIGWAYDGNPIYGPYGYSNKDGGVITQMKSGYKINENLNRPRTFPLGFFVEDYVYEPDADDATLDEFNGRFCITPEFPKGTYAYFTSIESSASLDSFDGYRLPKFPYVIGNKFKSKPIDFNFNILSNQDDYDFSNDGWIRNTFLYNLTKTRKSYSYIHTPNNLNQTIDIKFSSPGVIEDVDIVFGGRDYKVNDRIVFDDTQIEGYGFYSKVSEIAGKTVNSISVASTTINNAVIYPSENSRGSFVVQLESPHSLYNGNTINISGLSTTNLIPQRYYAISGIETNTFAISNPNGIGNISSTGIVTYVSVSGNIAFSKIRENDFFRVGNEVVKILSLDRKSSRIRILRGVDGTVGTSHSYSDILYELPRRFFINSGISSASTNRLNKQIYFDPAESLGIGSNFGVGIGATIYFSNPGVGITQIFIPTKTIYLPNHNLETGDRITYSTNGGLGIIVADNTTTGIGTTLPSDYTLFVAKVSEDLIGISTVKVGIGSTGTFVGIASTQRDSTTLLLTGIGTGTYHSFTTNYTELTGQLSKNTITVSTASSHGLSNNDEVTIDVKSGISTTIIVKYNDYSRKILINPKTFSSSDVNSETGTISISNHNFKQGQKLLFNSEENYGELQNNEIYYAIVNSKDTIKLSTSYYDANLEVPNTIGIGSTSSGILSPINPPITAYRNSTINFDVSDESLSYYVGLTSYSAFKLNFYTDQNFTDIFDSSIETDLFEVQRTGKPGITNNASVSLRITDKVPTKLFYRLDPIYEGNTPIEKLEVSTDDLVKSHNEINVQNSLYSGNYRITSISSTSFTYDITNLPEFEAYNKANSTMSYTTVSNSAVGPISKVKITSNGKNYYSLPKFSTITSSNGTGAILDASSTKIGKIEKLRINDIGFKYPSDKTLAPNISLPQILKIDPLNSIDYIKILSIGKGYSYPAKLVVIDGKTSNVIPEILLDYSFDNNNVNILNNSFRLNETTPTIIPTKNSNGIGIGSMSYNSTTNDVIVTLSVGFSTENSFPFSVGDKVLIENTNITGSGKGFNSKDYGYQLFTLNSIDANIGGIGTVSYNLSEFLLEGEAPGTFDVDQSSGRIIPEKHFPTFDIKLKTNTFLKGEQVRYGNESEPFGTVEGWNSETKQLRVSSKKLINSSILIKGLSSDSEGIINYVKSFNAFAKTGGYSKLESGWVEETGVLNSDTQRVQDNFYYQNFSYSLKSRVPYDTWKDDVDSLNHTVGFKNFSDLQLESTAFCGINTESISSLDSRADIDSEVNLNCTYDFDFARENSLFVGSESLSDEITFKNTILTDYYELTGNRVLTIDGQESGITGQNTYALLDSFPISESRAKKYIISITDRRYSNIKQCTIATVLHDDSTAYLNQYARLESERDLGSLDFEVDGDEASLAFYPTLSELNNYNITFLSYNLKDVFLGTENFSIGNIVDFTTTNNTISTGSTTTIVNLQTNQISSKVLVEISTTDGEYQYDEFNILHDTSNAYITEYGRLTSGISGLDSGVGLGTYVAYMSGTNLIVDFVPNDNIDAEINTIQISMTDSNLIEKEDINLSYASISAQSSLIPSSASPSSADIFYNSSSFGVVYYNVQIEDLTNNEGEYVELIILNNGLDEVQIAEFGNVRTNSSLGSFTASRRDDEERIYLEFTPIANILCRVKVFANYLSDSRVSSGYPNTYNEGTLKSNDVGYYGRENIAQQIVELYHDNDPIFKRFFDGSSSSTINVSEDTIYIRNHFFVTGEKVNYSYGNAAFGNQPISIAETDFGVGIGITNKLPETVYIIKVDTNRVRIAKSAEDALFEVPIPVDIVSTGTGRNHSFVSSKQNERSLISIDNIIQSPVTSTASTSKLSSEFTISDDYLYVDNQKLFFTGDLIKVDDEIMRVVSTGIGSTNSVKVKRDVLGTNIVGHSTGSIVTKLSGSYNIVDNVLYLSGAPYQNIPASSDSNLPDDRDWIGLSTSSVFQGRVFLKSGVIDSSVDTYGKNYIFDDISGQFNATNKTFSLTSNNTNVGGFYSDNAIVLVNDILQEPGVSRNFTLSEDVVGVTSISFVGLGVSNLYDVNTSGMPRSGVILSVGSTPGNGYQPLVAAGGTAVVSSAGTIASISIGNSGSGYRSSVQTQDGYKSISVRVGVVTSSVETPKIEFIGTATVSNGHIVSIAITNPGLGYTSTNPPYVVIDSPVPYSNIPLIHTELSGNVGTQAYVDIVVGQGSSVIDFELKNLGYNYSVGDTLTVPVGGVAGIPTITGYTYNQFELSVDKTFNDKFNAWSIGQLQPFDSIERLFDGNRVIFTLKYQGNEIALYTRKGSNISIENSLIILINDVIQEPGKSYIFGGGTKIEFTEPPKEGDTCKILFYKGAGDDIDVILTDSEEPIKKGDELILSYDRSLNQSPVLQENPRTVTDILISSAETNEYFGPGNTQEESLYRPITLCRQTEDKIINGQEIGKDRLLYEPKINPTSYLTGNLSVGSTVVYVDNLIPFFNPLNESQTSLQFQKNITIVSQETLVSASATAVVSSAGTIASISINDGGLGYIDNPTVSIQSPTGITSITSTAVSSITSGIVTSLTLTGIVTGYTQNNPPQILISPPTPKAEKNSVTLYQGDYGIIVGFGITTLGIYNQILMDLYIPTDSYLKDGELVSLPIVQSGLSEGDLFVVYESNTGIGTSLFASVKSDYSTIGISTYYANNVYQVSHAETIVVNVTDVGNAFVRRVFSKIVGLGTVNFTSSEITFDSDSYSFDNIETPTSYVGTISTSRYFGNYSWGKISMKNRRGFEFNPSFNINDTITSSVEVKRTQSLRYQDYSV